MAEQGRIARLFAALDRLSTREKVLVGGLAAALFTTLLGVSWLIVGGQIDELDARNTSIRNTLADVVARKDKFLQEKSRLEADKKRLDTNQVKLVRLMETQATALGITIEEFKESRRFLTENHRKQKRKPDGSEPARKVKDLVEESQTVTLRRVSVDQLARFMASLEARPEPVKVTRLSVQTLQSDRNYLREVRMTVATYRNEEVD